MRVAIVSDVHGNLPALEAARADIESQGVDEVWCGGDIAFGGPWARECIAAVRGAGWPTVKGNTDVWITGDLQGGIRGGQRRPLAAVAEAHSVSDDDASWLLNLPIGHSGPGSTLLVHGTPDSPFEGPLPDDPGSAFEGYEGRAQLVVYGHVHRAFVRRLKDGTIVANAGSVGLPFDGDTGSYLLVDLEGPDLLLRIRRFTFDRDRAVAEARRVGGPIEGFFLAMSDQR